MPLHITIANAGIRYRFIGTVRFFNKSKIGLKLHLNGLKENIEYIRTTLPVLTDGHTALKFTSGWITAWYPYIG